MKLIFSSLFTFIIWIFLFKFFFDDFEDLKKTTKNNLFWLAIDLILDSLLNSSSNFGGIRFLIFVGIGLLGGFLLYINL